MSDTNAPRIIAIVVGALVAGFVALVILLLLAVTFLGQKSDTKFSNVGSEIGAPALGGRSAPHAALG